jgi:hypothetical protein
MVKESEAKPAQGNPLHGQAAGENSESRPSESVKCSARRRDGQQRESAAQGLTAMFGLDPRAAVLTVLVDMLLFGGDLCTLGAFIPIAAAAAVALGFICYGIQTRWANDDHHSALIKAGIIALLCAIPVPIAPLVAVPGGIIGIILSSRRER